MGLGLGLGLGLPAQRKLSTGRCLSDKLDSAEYWAAVLNLRRSHLVGAEG